jgi:hypothetical protein
MREREMRQRIESFLQSRLRKMLAPATLGLGLAMTACPSSGLDANDDAGALVDKDAGADQGAAMKYMAQIPDAGPELPQAQPDYMAPQFFDARPDTTPALRYMAQMPDASQDTDRAVAIYMAPLPDSHS